MFLMNGFHHHGYVLVYILFFFPHRVMYESASEGPVNLQPLHFHYQRNNTVDRVRRYRSKFTGLTVLDEGRR